MNRSSDAGTRRSPSRQAAFVALAYVVASGLWILLSDGAVALMVQDAQLHTMVNIAKGWLFIAVTGALLFAVLLRIFRRLDRSRDALLASAATYREMFEANPTPMWAYDLDTLDFLAVNAAAVLHYGYSRAEFLKMNLRDIRPPEDVPRLLANVARVGRGLDQAGVWRHRRKNGELIEVQITSHTMNFAGRRAEIVLAHDVTAERRAQRALAESEERLRLALAGANQGLYDIDLVSGNSIIDTGYSRMLGYEAGELRETVAGLAERIHPDDRAHALQAYRDCVEGRSTEYRAEFRMRTREGDWKWILAVGSIMEQDGQGRPLRMIGTHTDITRSKLAEAALHEAQHWALAIVQYAQEGLVLFGTDTRFRLWNPFLERITGKSAADVLGRLPQEVFPASAEVGIVDAIRRALAGETVVLPDLPFHIAGSGDTGWFAAIHAPMRDVAGNITGAIASVTDITQRKRAEQQARLLSTAMEQSPASVVITDTDGRIQYVNPRFTEVTGYTAAEVIGSNPRILKSGHFSPDCYRELWDSIAAGRTWRGRFQNRKKSGELYWEDASISPVLDAAGRVSHFIAVKEDITARKQAEDALHESRTVLRTVIDSVPMWIASFDMHGRYVVANKRYSETFGLPLAQIEGAHISEVLPPSLLDIHKPLVEECLSGRAVTFSEAPPIPGRQQYFVQGIYVPLIDAAGTIIGGVVAVTDVTELRRSEEKLMASEARLNEAQRMAHICTWEHSAADNHLLLSDEGYRLLEQDPRVFGHTLEALFDVVHPQDRPLVEAGYANALRDHAAFDAVHRLRMPDGRIKHVHTHAEPSYDEHGKATQVLGTTQDITELKRAEDEVRALNQQLERRVAQRTAELERVNQNLEAFSYSVSHDLRAPLRAINGFSHLALESDGEHMSTDGRALLERVVRNSDRMGQLIDDILAYSRAGRAALQRRAVDLAELVHGLAEEARNNYPAIEIVVGALPVVSGDATMLRQVFANLLDNACKFSAGRPQPRVEIGATRDADGIVLHVGDNGAGFDMAYAGKLFGMFQRLHGESEFPGTGVGLAIVKRLVERHGGRIWVDAALDRGARFSFTIGPQEPDAMAAGALPGAAHEQPAAAVFGPQR